MQRARAVAALALATAIAVGLGGCREEPSAGVQPGVTVLSPSPTPTPAASPTGPAEVRPVAGLEARGTWTSVELTWTPPTGPDLAGVVIRRAAGPTPPATVDAGTQVVTMTGFITSFTDKGLASAAQFSYALFAQESDGRTAAAVTVTATTTAVPAADDAGLGTSFQALYLMPSDKTRRPSQVAAIGHELTQVNAWFAGQTGGRVPRWVPPASAAEGTASMSVVTVHLPRSTADYSDSATQTERIRADLKAVGWPRTPNQKLVAFIDADADDWCAVTEAGLSVIAEAACDIYPGARTRWPDGASYVTAHEMTHAFGAVPACAPHSDGEAHVNDDPRDVLYDGKRDRDWRHLQLDPGHDDYFGNEASGCPDITSSPFWTASP